MRETLCLLPLQWSPGWMRVSCCHHKLDNGLWHDNNVLFWWASVNSPGVICCWCWCWPKKSQTSICLKPVISTFRQIFCAQHCCVLQLAPKYFSETEFCVLKSFHLALLLICPFTIHIGSLERSFCPYYNQPDKSDGKLWSILDQKSCRPEGKSFLDVSAGPWYSGELATSVPANQPLHVCLSLVKRISIQHVTHSQMVLLCSVILERNKWLPSSRTGML